MRSIDCKLGEGSCDYMVTARTDSDAVSQMMEHIRDAHYEEVMVYGSEESTVDFLYGETREVGGYE